MTRYLGMALALMLVAGCASSPRTRNVPKPAAGSPMSGAKVVVHEFDTSGAEIFRASTIKAYGLDVANVIVEALRKAGVDAHVAVRGNEAPGDVIVTGKVVAVDGGISLLRTLVGWIGMVTGAGEFRAMGQVARSNGEVIGQFNRERRSGIGADNDGTVQRCIEAVGYDIAIMMTTGEYSTAP